MRTFTPSVDETATNDIVPVWHAFYKHFVILHVHLIELSCDMLPPCVQKWYRYTEWLLVTLMNLQETALQINPDVFLNSHVITNMPAISDLDPSISIKDDFILNTENTEAMCKKTKQIYSSCQQN